MVSCVFGGDLVLGSSGGEAPRRHGERSRKGSVGVSYAQRAEKDLSPHGSSSKWTKLPFLKSYLFILFFFLVFGKVECGFGFGHVQLVKDKN